MNNKEVIKKTAEYVRGKMLEEASGHDWWHVYRVWNLSKKIAKEEKDTNMLVVELAALLHDLEDWKFNDNKNFILTKKYLNNLEINKENVESTLEIVKNISFKGAGVKNKIKTKEGKIVQDADRLDAIGAIGIARVFAYGGLANREIHNPLIKPKLHKTFNQYKNNKGSSINHFYEKLLLLKNKLNTKTAKKIAVKRHEFIVKFLKEFFREWDEK